MSLIWEIRRLWNVECPNCENFTTESFMKFAYRCCKSYEGVMDSKLFHCFECGTWFRKK